jgi:cyclohexyl-isocyanide hydratase
VAQDRITIVFPVFPGLTLLDVAAPYEVLSRAPGVNLVIAGHREGSIEADNGVSLSPVKALAEVPSCDVICVPGGPGVDAAFLDELFMVQLRRLALGARYVASVATGALLLGALGLLENRRATTHWAAMEFLPQFGALATHERLVRDGSVFTCAGTGAGAELALALIEQVSSAEIAEIIQLSIVDSKVGPETASPGALKAFNDFMAPTTTMRRGAVLEAVAKRKAILQERAELTAAGLLPPEEPRAS